MHGSSVRERPTEAAREARVSAPVRPSGCTRGVPALRLPGTRSLLEPLHEERALGARLSRGRARRAVLRRTGRAELVELVVQPVGREVHREDAHRDLREQGKI